MSKSLSQETKEKINNALELIKKGHTLYQAAKEYNLNFETLRRYAHKNNIELQTPKQKKEIIFINNLEDIEINSNTEYQHFLKENNYSNWGFVSYLLSEYKSLKQTITKSAELLNILNSENLKLKKENEELKNKKSKKTKIVAKSEKLVEKEKRIEYLENENQKLKKEIEILKRALINKNSK